jgi:hypothetical protein
LAVAGVKEPSGLSLVVGWLTDPATVVGPVISAAQRDGTGGISAPEMQSTVSPA